MAEQKKDRKVYPSICDGKGNRILKGFRIENVNVQRRAEVIGAPIELGEKRFDNKVLQPIEVEITGYVQKEDYDQMIKEMVAMWKNRSYEFYWVFTRSGEELHDLCLQTLPFKESPEKFDLLYCTLNFKQIIITKKMRNEPAQVSDKSTAHGGMKGAR